MTLWELRFTDGRGASFFTDEDVTADIGRAELTRDLRVAAVVFEGSALTDARRCFEEGRLQDIVAHMGSVAFAVRHEL